MKTNYVREIRKALEGPKPREVVEVVPVRTIDEDWLPEVAPPKVKPEGSA